MTPKQPAEPGVGKSELSARCRDQVDGEFMSSGLDQPGEGAKAGLRRSDSYALITDWATPAQPVVCMLICMHSTSVRIDAGTHEELKRLAAELNTTVGNTVTLAVRALRQDRIGEDLKAALRDDEAEWLDADLG